MKNLRSQVIYFATLFALTLLFGKTSVVLSSTDRTAYYVVAANDAPSHVKVSADYVCDGTDDQVQIQAAISNVPLVFPSPTANRRVILSEGTFYCSGVITSSNRNINIQGQGVGVTNLCFSNSDGIKINLGVGDEYSATIRDLTLLTSSYRTGTAIEIEGNDDGRHVTIDSVTIKPTASQDATWTKGIVLKKVTRSVFSNIHIKSFSDVNRLVYGIFVGESCTDLVFENIDIFNADTGINIYHNYVDDQHMDIEGIRIYNPVLVGVDYGIYWSTPNANELDLQIHGGHINAELCGIYCNNIDLVFINGTTIFKMLPNNYFKGINISENCHSVSISNCKLENSGISDYYDYAIYVRGDRCSIVGNSIKAYDKGLFLTWESSYSTAVGNIIADTPDEIDNDGSNNWIDDSNIEVP